MNLYLYLYSIDATFDVAPLVQSIHSLSFAHINAYMLDKRPSTNRTNQHTVATENDRT